MNVIDLAYLVCLVAPIIVVIMLYFAYRKQKKTVEAQRIIDRRDRGPTLFLGNPRPQARQTPEEWEAHMEQIQKYPRRHFSRLLRHIPWKRRKEESPPLGPEPWEWK